MTNIIIVLIGSLVACVASLQSHVVSSNYIEEAVVHFVHDEARNFSQLLLDLENNQLVVGARDHIFRLNLDNLVSMDSHQWSSSQDTIKSCTTKGRKEWDCRNFVTVLHSNNGTLFACGTNAYAPLCRRYSPNDLNNILVEENGKIKSPYSPYVNSTSLMTENGDLYIGSTIDFVGNDPTFLRSGSRALLRTPQYTQEFLSSPQFVESLEIGEFVYFFFREDAVEYHGCGKNLYSRVGRVCKNDQGGNLLLKNSWTTFLKARLNCSLPGAVPFYFNEMQSVQYLKDEGLFYITFTTGENSIYGSAVCVYSLNDIAMAFRGPMTAKVDGWKKGKMVTDHFECKNRDSVVSHEDILDASKYQMTFSTVKPEGSAPVYHSELERLHHIQVDTVKTAHQDVLHVMFVITLEGTVKKIVKNPKSNVTCVIEETKPFREGEKVLRFKLLKDRESLYASTNMRVIKMPVSYCSQHKSQAACLSSGDPYCGWDSPEAKCSTAPKGNILDPEWLQGDACSADVTVVDGGWSHWSEWNGCERLAGIERTEKCMCRQRKCDSPAPSHGGLPCDGIAFQVTNCTQHGGWTDWSEWSACSQPCGPGFQHRTRSCTNPRAAFGGRHCIGSDKEERGCPTNPPCNPSRPVINSKTFWGEWETWSACSSPCGGGYQMRKRKCTSTQSKDCELGCSKEYRTCNNHVCPETYRFSEWTHWLRTNQSSHGHYEQRFKYSCVAQVPQMTLVRFGMVKKEERFCRDSSDCTDSSFVSVNGSWSDWSEWGACSATCGGGIQRRERTCDHPRPSGQGSDCEGLSIEERSCNVQSCPTDGWSEWSDWSECDGKGEQHRKRHCIAKNDYQRKCLAGVHTRESRICLHEGGSFLSANVIQCAGASTGAVIFAVFVSYAAGLVTVLVAVRWYNRRNRDDSLGSSTVSNSLQTIPTAKRIGSLPLVHVESNTYVPTTQFNKNNFNTLQSSPVKSATIKRSNTFRAQIGDDQNF